MKVSLISIENIRLAKKSSSGETKKGKNLKRQAKRESSTNPEGKDDDETKHKTTGIREATATADSNEGKRTRSQKYHT